MNYTELLKQIGIKVVDGKISVKDQKAAMDHIIKKLEEENEKEKKHQKAKQDRANEGSYSYPVEDTILWDRTKKYINENLKANGLSLVWENNNRDGDFLQSPTMLKRPKDKWGNPRYPYYKVVDNNNEEVGRLSSSPTMINIHIRKDIKSPFRANV